MAVIFIMRHAEKPDGAWQGVDERGFPDEQSLTVRGWQRAGALPGLFGPSMGLPAPDRIYAAAVQKRVTPTGKTGSWSKRSMETVSVLAAKLNLEVDDTFTRREEPALADWVARLEGTTLICWSREAIPAIAGALLGRTTSPPLWPSDRFDVIWRFSRPDVGQPWIFDQLCQCLLPGDGAKPIGT